MSCQNIYEMNGGLSYMEICLDSRKHPGHPDEAPTKDEPFEILRMVQKSGDHHPGCKKPVKHGANHQPQVVTAGFLNHQQYIENFSKNHSTATKHLDVNIVIMRDETWRHFSCQTSESVFFDFRQNALPGTQRWPLSLKANPQNKAFCNQNKSHGFVPVKYRVTSEIP